MRPLRVLELGNTYTMTVRVVGGGTTGQAGAIRHAVARALLRVNPEWRLALRKAGYLTRDPRMKERKKPGSSVPVRHHSTRSVNRCRAVSSSKLSEHRQIIQAGCSPTGDTASCIICLVPYSAS